VTDCTRLSRDEHFVHSMQLTRVVRNEIQGVPVRLVGRSSCLGDRPISSSGAASENHRKIDTLRRSVHVNTLMRQSSTSRALAYWRRLDVCAPLAAPGCAVCCLQAASQIGVGASGDGKWFVGRTGVHVLLDDGKD
jgi:hypothetical protein